MDDIKITNGRNNSAILSFFHILVGIWILVLTIPFLINIYYLITISYFRLELEPQILMGFLFHIIIIILLFSDSYHLYKNNENKIFNLSKISIFISLLYFLSIYIPSIIFYSADARANPSEFFLDSILILILYIFPVLIINTITIWYTGKSIKYIQPIIFLIIGYFIIIFSVPYFLNSQHEIKSVELTIDLSKNLLHIPTEKYDQYLMKVKIINFLSAISIVIGIILSITGLKRLIRSSYSNVTTNY